MMSTSQVQPIFDQTWPSFLEKLFVPASRQINEVGELLHRHLEAVNAHLLETPPRTLIHHDYDADNLFFNGSADTLGLSVIDWQMTTGGRPAVDIAWLIGGQCEPRMRRENEEQLLRLYHSLLLENGVHEYAFEQCWDDYRLAMLLPAARIAVAVGVSQTPPDWGWVLGRRLPAILPSDRGPRGGRTAEDRLALTATRWGHSVINRDGTASRPDRTPSMARSSSCIRNRRPYRRSLSATIDATCSSCASALAAVLRTTISTRFGPGLQGTTHIDLVRRCPRHAAVDVVDPHLGDHPDRRIDLRPVRVAAHLLRLGLTEDRGRGVSEVEHHLR